jgi:CPA1 family monovalent cation:H+ antiporter
VHHIDLIVALVLAAAGLSGLANAIGVHYAIVLVVGGLVLGFIPGVPEVRVAPDTVLFVFLPPLIYAAAFGSSARELRANARTIGVLAIGLVLATMAGVGAVVHAVSGIGWGPAMVLGAILGPTDPVAATSVLRRVGAPERVSAILEGEALINDGTGLTVYTLAVSAAVAGHFSPAGGVLKFLAVAAGGVVIGWLAGWLAGQVRRRVDDAPIEVSISLLTAYLAYLPAQRLGASGVLAATAAGLYASSQADLHTSAPSRLQMLGFWEALTFLLESVLFLLIGLQLRSIAHGLPHGVGTPLADAGVVLAALVAIRLAWMFVVPRLGRLLARGRASTPDPRELAVLGWSGMRGGLSLAAALAIPLTAHRGPFADRGTVIFIAFVAIAVSLVVPGLTLMPLARRLGVGESGEAAEAEAAARVRLAQAALARLDEAAREGMSAQLVEGLRTTYELRLHRLRPPEEDADSAVALAEQGQRLRRELIDIQRRTLRELRDRDGLSLRSQRQIERELDLEESRLTG